MFYLLLLTSGRRGGNLRLAGTVVNTGWRGCTGEVVEKVVIVAVIVASVEVEVVEAGQSWAMSRLLWPVTLTPSGLWLLNTHLLRYTLGQLQTFKIFYDIFMLVLFVATLCTYIAVFIAAFFALVWKHFLLKKAQEKLQAWKISTQNIREKSSKWCKTKKKCHILHT